MTREEAIKQLRRGKKLIHPLYWNENVSNQYIYIKGRHVMYGGNKIPEKIACNIDAMSWIFLPDGWEIYDDVFDRFLEGIKLL